MRYRKLAYLGLSWVFIWGIPIQGVFASDCQRVIGRISEKNRMGSRAFVPGDLVYVSRSDGKRSIGEIININPENQTATVRANYFEAPEAKVVSLKVLLDENPFVLGEYLEVPRTRGPPSLGEVMEVDPDLKLVTVRVRQADKVDSFGTKVLSFDKVNRPREFEFSSTQKVTDYVSASGDRINIDYGSANLQFQIRLALERMVARGAKPHVRSDRPTQQELESVSQAWLGDTKLLEQTRVEVGGDLLYGKKRDQIIEASGGQADLGEIIACKAAVCRELSLFGSLALAELGYATQVATGKIQKGKHAWIEFLDPQGRVIGILDSNYTERFHSDPEQYYQLLGVKSETLKREILAIPAKVQ